MRELTLDREIVTSTDMNRRPGEILDHAEDHPVLIQRGEPLVLVRHAIVRGLVDAEAHTKVLAELSEYLAHRLGAESPDRGGPFDWLNEFDAAELSDFVAELRATVRDALSGLVDWTAFDDVLEEWHESSIRPPEYVAALERTKPVRA